ncbi:hypothetical protein FB45DRAFT_863419 [Roridomyces roridus]|uniref:Uncharacterized protein n=1 Tax=Roridomyces roridus TaxID=1738132 RepID=A0AAD7C3W5_9AGAR|nr:hypothetical protein FB45DRAFT_863419 [Roridomyces roridus]
MYTCPAAHFFSDASSFFIRYIARLKRVNAKCSSLGSPKGQIISTNVFSEFTHHNTNFKSLSFSVRACPNSSTVKLTQEGAPCPFPKVEGDGIRLESTEYERAQAREKGAAINLSMEGKARSAEALTVATGNVSGMRLEYDCRSAYEKESVSRLGQRPAIGRESQDRIVRQGRGHQERRRHIQFQLCQARGGLGMLVPCACGDKLQGVRCRTQLQAQIQAGNPPLAAAEERLEYCGVNGPRVASTDFDGEWETFRPLQDNGAPVMRDTEDGIGTSTTEVREWNDSESSESSGYGVMEAGL